MCNSNSRDVERYLYEIADNLKNGHAAVMIGSGFSKNADDGGISQKSFPNWNELADIFYKKLYGESIGEDVRYKNPTELAEEVEAAFGRPVLDRILMDSIPNEEYKPSILHKKLLKLPWKDIFTTNYDTLLERASEQITEKRFKTIVRKEDLINSAGVSRIVKLHGSFPSNRPFIITNEDYRSYPNLFAPFVNTVQQSLLENTLCLIGFSGTDPNFLNWIGWIHDNLGKANSPKIYLIDMGTYSNGKMKLLHDKNVIVVNLAEWKTIKGGYSAYLEEFIDFLQLSSDNVKSHKWPSTKSIDPAVGSDFSEIDELIEYWKRQRIAYPGWIILPESRRQNLKYQLDGGMHILNILKNNIYKNELAFLYEYNWIKERCLQPLFSMEIDAFNEILKRYSLERSGMLLKENKNMWISLQLSVLRSHREIGNSDSWNELNRILDSQRSGMTLEQQEQLYYEECMFWLFCFDIEKLKQKLEQWVISDRSPIWAIRKAGLLAEVGNLSQAIIILQEILTNVRHQINLSTEAGNCKLLSLESCAMSLLMFITNAAKGYFEKEDKDSIQFDFDRNWQVKQYEADFWEERNVFDLKLSLPPKTYSTSRREATFDFGVETISRYFGDDTEALTAFACLRFYEETGQPFRLKSVSNESSICGIVQRISKYYSNWSTVTVIRSGKKEGISFIFSRSSLNMINMHNASQLCKIYLDVLNNMENDIYNSKRFEPQNVSSITASVLPEILSRLCTKCSLEVLDLILSFVKRTYTSGKCINYNGMDNLIKRLIQSYTDNQLIQRINDFLEFPLFKDDSIEVRYCPDPFNYIELQKDVISYKIKDGVINILIKKGYDRETRTGAIRRLLTLYKLKMLSDEQEKGLATLLWSEKNDKTGLPNLKDYYRSAYKYFPYPHDVEPEKIFKKAILMDIDEINKNLEKLTFSKNNRLLQEILFATQDYIFDSGEKKIIILFCVNIWNQCKSKLYNDGRSEILMSSNEIATDYSYMVGEILSTLLLHGSEEIIDDGTKALIITLLSEMKNKQIATYALEIIINKYFELDYGDIYDNIINGFLVIDSKKNIKAFQAICMIVDNMKNLNFDIDTIRSLIKIVTQQIIWRSDKNLYAALDVVVFLTEKHMEILDDNLLNDVLVGIKALINKSVINAEDSNEAASQKGEIRMEGAKLAYNLSKYYADKNMDIPNIIKQWNQICNDVNEFSEIRNQWKDNS